MCDIVKESIKQFMDYIQYGYGLKKSDIDYKGLSAEIENIINEKNYKSASDFSNDLFDDLLVQFDCSGISDYPLQFIF